MMNWKRYGAYALAVIFAGILLVFGVLQNRKNEGEATRSFFAMDTYMTITVYGSNSEIAAQKAEELIHTIEQTMSTGLGNSEISRLNRSKKADVSEDTAYLIRESLELYKGTEGAFDISIYPLAKEWGFAGGEKHVPTKERLYELLQNVDASRISIGDQREVLLPDGMEIDLGGIAKGYTAQKVADLLSNEGITSAKLDLGGNIQLLGAKPNGTNWRIAIRHPKDDGKFLGIVTGSDIAIVTSGGYERFFEEAGITYHHILDPSTGYPANNGLLSVTIVCKDGTRADALSTALFVLGPERAMNYWRVHKNEFDAVLMLEDGTLLVTDGLSNCFESECNYQFVH